MNEPRFAAARADGLFPYVITETRFGIVKQRIEWAATLGAAKAKYGWNRQTHTEVRVTRATPNDLPQ